MEAKKVINYSGPLEELAQGYAGKEFTSTYGDVKQRWLLVASEQAYAREAKALQRRIQREKKAAAKDLSKLAHIEFRCEQDARKALARWSKRVKYHNAQEVVVTGRRVCAGRGRPKAGAAIEQLYRISAVIAEDSSRIAEALRIAGRFVIATNELDTTLLSSREFLLNYKGQQSVERGFRFLKEPAFMTPSVHLKNQKGSSPLRW